MNAITATTRSTDPARFDPITSWDALQPPQVVRRRDEPLLAR